MPCTEGKLADSVIMHHTSNVARPIWHLSWAARSNRTAHSASNSNLCCCELAGASVGDASVDSLGDEEADSICSP